MRKSFLILFILLGISISAQKVKVKKQFELKLETEKAYYPTLNKKGDKVLFSKEGYSGLYFYDFNSEKTKKISDAQNSGYDPLFSADDAHIFYRKTNFEKGKRYDALESYNIKKSQKKQMLSPRRDLKPVRDFHNGVLVQAGNMLLKSTFGRSKAKIPIYVYSENLKIHVFIDGKKHEIDPFKGENRNYIWASLAPDSKKILFTATGKGTYVCDLRGNIVAKLGYLNAPIWYDENYVVGMQDKDDGDRTISSSVLILSVDGKVKHQISNPKHIAQYPTASAEAGKVIYHTSDGKLVVSEIEIIK